MNNPWSNFNVRIVNETSYLSKKECCDEISLIATLMTHPSWEIRIDTKSERTKHRLLLGAVYQLALIYRARHPKMWTHSGFQNRLVITKD